MMLRQRIWSSGSHDSSIVAYPRRRPRHPLPSAVCRRVVVVGSANVDLVWHGRAACPRRARRSPTASSSQVLGGKGANQAAAAAALGAEVHFVGCVGADEHGRLVRADLEARGRRLHGARDHGRRRTGVAAHHRRRAAARTRSRSRPARTERSPRRRRRGDPARRRRAVLARDPGGDRRGRGRGCDRPRRAADREPGTAAGRARGRAPHTQRARMRAPRRRRPRCSAVAPAVIVTLGSAGVVLHRAGHAPARSRRRSPSTSSTPPARATRFNGALGVGARSEDKTLDDALPLACAAGALATPSRRRPRVARDRGRGLRARHRLTDQLERGRARRRPRRPRTGPSVDAPVDHGHAARVACRRARSAPGASPNPNSSGCVTASTAHGSCSAARSLSPTSSRIRCT